MKFTIGKILSGHLWYTKVWDQVPPPLSSHTTLHPPFCKSLLLQFGARPRRVPHFRGDPRPLSMDRGRRDRIAKCGPGRDFQGAAGAAPPTPGSQGAGHGPQCQATPFFSPKGTIRAPFNNSAPPGEEPHTKVIWAKFSSGPSANQKFSPTPSARVSLDQKFSSAPLAPLKNHHHWRGGGGALKGAPRTMPAKLCTAGVAHVVIQNPPGLCGPLCHGNG